ncbi:MAG: hypothetical protein JWO73_255 [Candidatus Taylorbacteria bacterium]|nr:hypothetical protein [Candidatus Taylorbacteria bacterium]
MNQISLSPYWSEEDLHVLAGITDFLQMVTVGNGILDRMAVKSDKRIVQLCAPMSRGGRGSLDANMAYFRKAQRVASDNGLYLFDQGPFQEAMIRLSAAHEERKEYCYDILHVFYRGIFKSRRIGELMFLPDWETSIGAKWEREEAPAHGLLITEYPEEWLMLIEE